jgi:HAD superfamily phosphatase
MTAALAYSEVAPGLRGRIGLLPAALGRTDAVLFDIDGVLVEVSDSFRSVISLAVQHYFNRVLGIPGEEPLITPDETSLFKLAGRYNNDWDLANGAAAWGLLKLVTASDGDAVMASLRQALPALEEFTVKVRQAGGGLETTLRLLRGQMNEVQRRRFENLYRPDLIRRIFQEYYAGPGLCRRFYGFDPEYFSGPGLVERERPILDLSLVKRLKQEGLGFGVLSGRTPEEADYVLETLGLAGYLHPRGRVVDDGSLPGKPDPSGLLHLARGMGFRQAVYVGDVPDDWTTVEAYRKTAAPGLGEVNGCMVATGANPGGRITAHFERAGADWLASDVNVLLRTIIETRSGNRPD